jgi:hypothetical protein
MTMFLFIWIAAVEIAARVLFPDYADDQKYFNLIYSRVINSGAILDKKTDEKFGWHLSPNTSRTAGEDDVTFVERTNSIGFRTKEIQPRQPDEWRVMVVGDSCVWGAVPYEYTIANLLEQLGRQQPGLQKKLSTYSMGIPGYNTVQEYVVAETYAPVIQPDQIVLCIYFGNDVVPNGVTYVDDNGNFAVSEQMLDTVKSEIRSQVGVLRHSMIFRIASLSPYTTRMYYNIARRPDVMEKNYDLLDRFKAYCERNHIEFTVVILYPKDGAKGGLHQAWTRSRSVGHLLADHCKARGIDVIDMLDYIHGQADTYKNYYHQGGHPNATGNTTISRVIFDKSVVNRLKSRESARAQAGDRPTGDR